MLKTLEIENLLIIEKINLDFENGFNVIVGETGSGKSILLDCLLIILGGRSTKDLIGIYGEKARIVAIFDISNNYEIKNILNENEINYDNEMIVIKKVIAKDYSKIFINDNLVSMNFIASIKDHLIEIHCQFEKNHLSNDKFLFYLDQFLNINKKYQLLFQFYDKMKILEKELKMEELNVQTAKDNFEYLIEIKKDLENLSPKNQEYEELLTKRNLLFHNEKITSSFNDLQNEIQKVNLKDFTFMFTKQTAKIDQYLTDKCREKISLISSNLDQSLSLFQEARELFSILSDNFVSSDNLLAEIEERISSFKDLARKYKSLPEGLYKLYYQTINEIKLIEFSDEKFSLLKKDFESAKKNYLSLASEISQMRKNGKNEFLNQIKYHLSDLGLEKARIDIKFYEDFNKFGIDKIEFLASMNFGLELMEIGKIASGGELSRLILALKIVISNKKNNILFFDEIDSGVSGKVATMIGIKLKELGCNGQVFTISHNPQVISKALNHFLVEKKHQEDKTKTTIKKLNYQEKIKFIASIISGDKINNHAIENAIMLCSD